MARIVLNPAFRSIRGRFGDIVLYNINGKEYARVYKKPAYSNTEEQKIVRKTFGDAVRSWQELTSSEKYRYNTKARRLRTKGYNLYISIYMKKNIPAADNGSDRDSLYTASSRCSAGITLVTSSVPSTFFPALCSGLPSELTVHLPGS